MNTLDWADVRDQIDVTDRVNVLASIHKQLTDADIRTALAESWHVGTQVKKPVAFWVPIFRRAGVFRADKNGEPHDFAVSSRRFLLYRGATPAWARGLSWTPDYIMAAAYASRPGGRIYQTDAPSNTWLAVFDASIEVVLDPRRVHITRAPVRPISKAPR